MLVCFDPGRKNQDQNTPSPDGLKNDNNGGRRRISILLFSCGLTLAGFRVKLDSFNKLEIFEVEGERRVIIGDVVNL